MTSILVVFCMIICVYLAYTVKVLHKNIDDLNTLVIYLLQRGEEPDA